MKLSTLTLLLCGAASVGHAATLKDAMTGPWPLLPEGPGGTTFPDDGIFHVDGNWSVNYGGAKPILFLQSLATFTGPNHHLQLTVPSGQYEGSEIASDAAWTFNGTTFPYGTVGTGFGYYQMTVQTAAVGNSANNTGVVNSFFLKGAPCCGPVQEIDFEFLTNETWLTSATGAVHCTITSPGGSISQKVNLPFNPSKAPHRYGLLWTKDGTVKFYADGKLIDTETNPQMVPPANGMTVMANAWTGNPNWGGLPPAGNATATYAFFRYVPNATAIPASAILPDPTR